MWLRLLHSTVYCNPFLALGLGNPLQLWHLYTKTLYLVFVSGLCCVCPVFIESSASHRVHTAFFKEDWLHRSRSISPSARSTSVFSKQNKQTQEQFVHSFQYHVYKLEPLLLLFNPLWLWKLYLKMYVIHMLFVIKGRTILAFNCVSMSAGWLPYLSAVIRPSSKMNTVKWFKV